MLVLKVLLGLIGVVCLAGAVVVPWFLSEEQNADVGKLVRKWSLPLGVAGLIAILLLMSFVQVNAGHVGVVKKFGAVTGKKFSPGLHVIAPIVESVEIYRTQTLIYETSDNPENSTATYRDYSVKTMTEDGQRITVRFTVAFNINGDKAGWIAQNIGTEGDVVEKVVKANARSEARNVPKLFKASDLYGKNVYECQRALFEKLEPVFAKNGVTVTEFLLRDIGFDESLAQALEQKQIALENQVTASRNVDVRTAEASQAIATAKGEAQARIEKARGDAESIRRVNEELAKAPYYSQYLVSKGIAEGTTDIKWALLPSGSTPLVDMREATAAAK